MRGHERKLYVSTSTSFAAPAWVEVKVAGDVNVPRSYGKSEVARRGSNGLLEAVSNLLTIGFEGKLVYEPSDAGYTRIVNCFNGRLLCDALLLNFPISVGGQVGIRIYGEVFDLPQSHPMQGHSEVDFSIWPSPYAEYGYGPYTVA